MAKTITKMVAEVADRVVAKVDDFLFPTAALKKAVEKQDVATIRKILTEHQVDVRMADILMMVPAEAARLQAVIDENSNLQNCDSLEVEMSTLRRITPASPEQAVEVAKAIEDCKRRQDKSWFGQFKKSDAEGELLALKITFSELIDGKLSTQFCGTTPAIDEKMREIGLDKALVQSTNIGGWRDIFKLQPITQQQRRRRLVARS